MLQSLKLKAPSFTPLLLLSLFWCKYFFFTDPGKEKELKYSAATKDKGNIIGHNYRKPEDIFASRKYLAMNWTFCF